MLQGPQILFTSDRINWRAAPQTPPALSDEVHVWQLRLDESIESLAKALGSDELARAEKFHFELDRHRYIAGRALMRAILAKYLAITPEAISFEYGPRGKPRLLAPDAPHFNFSHSDDLALLAVRRAGPVGIDVERIDQPVDHLALAAEHFSPEEASTVASAPPACRAEAFFRIWTRREAILKASGVGLDGASTLDEFRGQVQEFVPAPLFIAALCLPDADV